MQCRRPERRELGHGAQKGGKEQHDRDGAKREEAPFACTAAPVDAGERGDGQRRPADIGVGSELSPRRQQQEDRCGIEGADAQHARDGKAERLQLETVDRQRDQRGHQGEDTQISPTDGAECDRAAQQDAERAKDSVDEADHGELDAVGKLLPAADLEGERGHQQQKAAQVRHDCDGLLRYEGAPGKSGAWGHVHCRACRVRHVTPGGAYPSAARIPR